MRRSERLVDMTNFLLEHPYEMLQLNFFIERYEASKSTISEDLEIVDEVFGRQGLGAIHTFTGAAGGFIFRPDSKDEVTKAMAEDLRELMSREDRILPGGYLYLSDVVGHPKNLKKIGRIIAHAFKDKQIDAVMTIATKGIPIAQATAEILSVPFVVTRRDPKVTEGPTLSVNYMSGSSAKVESMVLSKRALSIGQKVLIVDDFMKGGGTLSGMVNLVKEMDCLVAGKAVFIEGPFKGERPTNDYKSILKVDQIDLASHSIDVHLGNMFDK